MKYKTTQKDRYGNMRSLEIDTGENNLEVPPMTSMIPQYEAVGGLAENHPGEPKGSDTVPAWLTPGEFVVNKEAVDMYGPQIKKMNDVGREVQDGDMNPDQAPPMYAYGGQPVYAKHGTDIKDERVVKMLDAIIIAEGGAEFTDYPGDPPTKFGVTLPTYKDYIDPNGTIEDLKKLTENEARQLFYDEYFIRPGIHKLPEEMWHNVLDQTINSGPKGAISILQRTVGSNVDGAIGPNTIKAANSFIENVPTSSDQNSEIVFNNLYSLGRDKRYKWLVAEDNKLPEPKDPKNIQKNEKRNLQQFEDGWLDRSNKFKIITPPPSKPKPNLVDHGFEHLLGKNNPGVQDDEGNWHYDTSLIGGETQIDIPRPLNSDQSFGDAVVDTVQSGINVVRDRAGNIINWIGDTAANIRNVQYPTSEELYGQNKNKGGPIHAYNGMQIPLTRGGSAPWWETVDLFPGRNEEEEKINPVPVDYGSAWNPFDTTHKYPVDYPSASPNFPVVPTLPVAPDIPVSDWNADPDKITPPRPELAGDFSPDQRIDSVAGSFSPDQNVDINIEDIFKNGSLGAQNDSTTITNMGGGSNTFAAPELPDIDTFNDIQPGPYTGGLGTDEESISSYEIPPEDIDTFNDIQPGPYTGGLGADEDIPLDFSQLYRSKDSSVPEMFSPDIAGSFDPSKNTPGTVEPSGYDWTRDDWRHKKPSAIQSSIDYKEKELALFVKRINDLDKNDSRYKGKLEGYRKKIKDKEAEIASEKEALAMSKATSWNETNVYKPMIKEAKVTAELTKWKNKLDDPGITSTEKSFVENKIVELEKKWSETDTSKTVEAWENKLKEESKKVDTKTEESMYNHWESAKGQTDLKKIYADGDSNPNWNKAKDMLKGTLGFLFGDIFDSGELGRAIAVYLGSRALGYQHGESIGFVSKQYLKRVDAKNTAYDKWLLANSGKYTKKSLSKFKKTRDPAHLIPVGSVPRSQGEQEKWYDKNGKARMAYKFKIKDGAGDDHVYWSWDKSGKSEVEEGWHQDPKSVSGTTEFKAEGKKYRDDIEEQLKALKNQYDIHKHRDDKKGVYTNKYHTDIMPSIEKDDVYNWAIKNNVQPDKIGGFLKQAMVLATKEARKSDDKPGTILPYLDRVTIDERTRDFPKLMKDGEYELEDMDMVRLNQKITENYGAPTNFYNAAWQEWQKGKRKVDGESWPKVFKELAAKDEANEAGWPPFALFVDNLLHEWMKENATKRGSADFVLDEVAE